MSYAEVLYRRNERELDLALMQSMIPPSDLDLDRWSAASSDAASERMDAALRLLGVRDGIAGIDTQAPEWGELKAFLEDLS